MLSSAVSIMSVGCPVPIEVGEKKGVNINKIPRKIECDQSQHSDIVPLV